MTGQNYKKILSTQNISLNSNTMRIFLVISLGILLYPRENTDSYLAQLVSQILPYLNFQRNTTEAQIYVVACYVGYGKLQKGFNANQRTLG